MSLKTEAQKGEFLKVLKIAHENFTWSGREIPHVDGMVNTNGKDIWLRELDARAVFPLSTEFWLSRISSKHITSNLFNE